MFDIFNNKSFRTEKGSLNSTGEAVKTLGKMLSKERKVAYDIATLKLTIEDVEAIDAFLK